MEFCFKQNSNACGYFKWVEPETCKKGMEIGTYFHGRMEEMQARINHLQQQNKQLQRASERVNDARVATMLQNDQLVTKCEEFKAIIQSLQETVAKYKWALKERRRIDSKVRKLISLIIVVLIVVVIAVMKEKKKEQVYFLP